MVERRYDVEYAVRAQVSLALDRPLSEGTPPYAPTAFDLDLLRRVAGQVADVYEGNLYVAELKGPYPNIFDDPDFDHILRLCDGLLKTKGNDYSQGEAALGTRVGRLKNFYSGAERSGVTPFQALSILMYKHWGAIETFIQKGQVESEPIKMRIVDSINYLLLLYKLIENEKETPDVR